MFTRSPLTQLYRVYNTHHSVLAGPSLASSRSADFYRPLIDWLNQYAPKIRFLVQHAPNSGNQSATRIWIDNLIDLGYTGSYEIFVDSQDAALMQKFFGASVNTVHYREKYEITFYKLSEELPEHMKNAHLVINPARDNFFSDDNKYIKAQEESAQVYIQSQPTRWRPEGHYIKIKNQPRLAFEEGVTLDRFVYSSALDTYASDPVNKKIVTFFEAKPTTPCFSALFYGTHLSLLKRDIETGKVFVDDARVGQRLMRTLLRGFIYASRNGPVKKYILFNIIPELVEKQFGTTSSNTGFNDKGCGFIEKDVQFLEIEHFEANKVEQFLENDEKSCLIVRAKYLSPALFRFISQNVDITFAEGVNTLSFCQTYSKAFMQISDAKVPFPNKIPYYFPGFNALELYHASSLYEEVRNLLTQMVHYPFEYYTDERTVLDPSNHFGEFILKLQSGEYKEFFETIKTDALKQQDQIITFISYMKNNESLIPKSESQNTTKLTY